MKIIIDMDKLGVELTNLGSNASKGNYLLNKVREIHGGDHEVSWASEHKEVKSKARPSKYTPLFEEFWKLYPRKIGKGGAFKSWWRAAETLNSEPFLYGFCIAALAWQVTQDQWVKDDGKFIPHPQTWLNNCCWDDEDPHDGKPMEEYLADDGTVKSRRVE